MYYGQDVGQCRTGSFFFFFNGVSETGGAVVGWSGDSRLRAQHDDKYMDIWVQESSETGLRLIRLIHSEKCLLEVQRNPSE